MSCELTLKEILDATKGEALSSICDSFKGVGTDTREQLQGRLFIALKGSNFDAHEFLKTAVEKDSAGLLIHQLPEDPKELEALKRLVTVIKVKDTLKALQDLANYWRHQIKAKVIAISGSNGKTTTKGFTASLLANKFKTVASPASFNNHWGVPITLLSVSRDDEMAILEMGMNHSGELTRLCEIAEPELVAVTTVGRAHIGELGSQQAVAHAKEELYVASPKAIQVFNLDNEWTIDMYKRAQTKLAPNKMVTFSSYNPAANISMRVTHMQIDSITVGGHIFGVKGEAKIPVFGRHNVVNLMASSAIAHTMGLTPAEIWRAMPLCRSNWGRNQLVKTRSGALVLFDAYNANPESMAAMVKNLFEIYTGGRKVVVVGEMLELGDNSDKLHIELGEMLGSTDVDMIWFIGPHKDSFEQGIKKSGFSKTYFLSESYDLNLAKQIAAMLNPKDIAVIKGSRGIRLEQVLKAWEPVDFQLT